VVSASVEGNCKYYSGTLCPSAPASQTIIGVARQSPLIFIADAVSLPSQDTKDKDGFISRWDFFAAAPRLAIPNDSKS